MTRCKNFDVQEVTIEMMQLFRRQGYDRTSVSDLEEASGLKAGSLYNAFGSKHEIFLAALDCYLSSVVAKRIGTYLRGDDPVAAIDALFTSTFVNNLKEHCGCLLTNTAVELGRSDAQAHRLVMRGLQAFESEFARLMLCGQELGIVRRDRDAQALARHLLLSYQGLLVMVKIVKDESVLRGHVADILAAIAA